MGDIYRLGKFIDWMERDGTGTPFT